MNVTCPECGEVFADDDFGTIALVHCPACGRGIARAEAGRTDAAAWGPSRLSGLAVLSLVCGILSLAAPLCLCLPALFIPALVAGGSAGGRGPIRITTTPTGTPTSPVTVTFPDGTTGVIDPDTGQPVPVEPDDGDGEEAAPPDDAAGDGD